MTLRLSLECVVLDASVLCGPSTAKQLECEQLLCAARILLPLLALRHQCIEYCLYIDLPGGGGGGSDPAGPFGALGARFAIDAHHGRPLAGAQEVQNPRGETYRPLGRDAILDMVLRARVFRRRAGRGGKSSVSSP